MNGNAACISVIRDISGEIEAKQKLFEESVENRQQKNILQNIIDTMPSGLLQCSFDRIPKALMVNRTGANILGFENEHEFFCGGMFVIIFFAVSIRKIEQRF